MEITCPKCRGKFEKIIFPLINKASCIYCHTLLSVDEGKNRVVLKEDKRKMSEGARSVLWQMNIGPSLSKVSSKKKCLIIGIDRETKIVGCALILLVIAFILLVVFEIVNKL